MITNGRKTALSVNRGGADLEETLEGIDGDPRVGLGAVRVVGPRNVVVEELARTIVSVAGHHKIGFRVDVQDLVIIERAEAAARTRLDQEVVANLPRIGTMAGAAVGRALDVRRMADVNRA